MKNSARSTFNALLSIAAASSLVLLILVMSGCGTEEKTADTGTEPFVAETTSQKPLNQQFLYEMAVKRIGDPNLVRTASISGEGSDKVVTFEVVRPAVCHDGAVVGTVSTFSQKTMSSLFKYPEVSRVDVVLYGTTQDASSNNEVAVKVTVDRNSAQKIDWFALSDTNLADLVTTFYIDPRIQANWQVDGGGSTPRTGTTATVPVT
ncbi:MAG: hypothetical protein Q7K29_07200 [Thermoleophilia bacterium]|nr:hypothetical protein [Thermoleophilia bacterium]